MGVIVDTSTLVTAERRKRNVCEIFRQLRETFGDAEAGLSVVTLVELAHGIERAELDAQRIQRQAFLDDLISDIEIYPVTSEIALLAGKISGQQARHGINLPFEDLLIGATALHHGCEVVTENIRHFEMIPGLTVKKH
jgi:predicted nucleic acid-binding protein